MLVLACGLAAILHYGFWLGGFAGILLDHNGLKALAVGILLLNGYLIYYRVKGAFGA